MFSIPLDTTEKAAWLTAYFTKNLPYFKAPFPPPSNLAFFTVVSKAQPLTAMQLMAKASRFRPVGAMSSREACKNCNALLSRSGVSQNGTSYRRFLTVRREMLPALFFRYLNVNK